MTYSIDHHHRDCLMLATIAQLPSVLVLSFNISCSICTLILTATLTKLRLISPQPDGTVVFPSVLQSRYQYPRSTDILWALAGTLWFHLLLSVLLHFFPANPYLTHTYTPYVQILFIYVALLRLDCWRLFVADFLREVWRLKEFAIINEVLAECCQFKLEQHQHDTSTTLRQRGSSTTPDLRLKVLDFGGGKGKTTQHMLEHCSASVQSVEAIDIEEYPPHVKKYDGAVIPYPPQSFDIAVAMYVFHHIPETPPLIQQLRKTCQQLLIFEDLPDDTALPLVSKLTFGAHFLLFNQSVHTVHAHHSQKEWHALFKDWGMTVVKEYDIPPTSALPYKRIAFLLDVGKEGE